MLASVKQMHDQKGLIIMNEFLNKNFEWLLISDYLEKNTIDNDVELRSGYIE